MNPPPLPIGGLTNKGRHKTATGPKGFLSGKGKWILIVAAALIGAGWTSVDVMTFMRSDEAGELVLQAAQSSKVLQQELGEPMAMELMSYSGMGRYTGDVSAEVTISIAGPKGEARVCAQGTRKSGGPWVFSKMEAIVKDTGMKVDLR